MEPIRKKPPQIKICGITRPEEALYLNEIQADYAGFVFWEKSKRYVTFEKAEEIRQQIKPGIKCVAVTVSPEPELSERIAQAGFDILQVHGELKPEISEYCQIPIWRACNLKEPEDIKRLEQHEKITGYVIDAGTYGSGRTFDWNRSKEAIAEAKGAVFAGKKFILAGGLKPENAAEAIAVFSPDVVDVSSGVEGENGKSEALMKAFMRKVREDEE